MVNQCFFGDCRDTMRDLIAKGVKVNCIVTSPPYWGLRDYGIPPSVWGGDPKCQHDWNPETVDTEIGKGNWTQAVNGRGEVQGEVAAFREPIRASVKRGFCRHCSAWLGCLGLEPDFKMFITHMVEVFDLARELLTDDGVAWVNMGDSYSGSWGNYGGKNRGNGEQREIINGSKVHQPSYDGLESWKPPTADQTGLKPKDLCLIPDRLGIALQDSGWWVRSKLPWIKRNGMPESTTDRPAQSVEYVFMLTKRARYFYDGAAVKVKSSPATNERKPMQKPSGWDDSVGDGGHGASHKHGREGARPRKLPEEGSGVKNNDSMDADTAVMPSARNFRVTDLFFQSWQGLWSDEEGEQLALIVNTSGFKGAHFATFPPKLIEPLILASTSAHGHCPKCGTGWKRITTKGKPDLAHQQACGGNVDGEYHGEAVKEYAGTGAQDASEVKARILEGMRETVTTGWMPGCECTEDDRQAAETATKFEGKTTAGRLAKLRQAARAKGGEYAQAQAVTTGWEKCCECALEPVPAIVFDPFFGSGTTGQASQALGRNWLGCDMNPNYKALQDERTRQEGLPL